MRLRSGSFRYVALLFATALLGAGGDDSQAPVRPVSDTYFGTAIVDPYRYMESGDPAYVTWKAGQLAATAAMLARVRATAGLSPAATFPARNTDLAVANGHAFYEVHTATSDALVENDLHGGNERVLVTDNTYATDGSAQLGAFAVSDDAKLIAIHVYVGKAIQDIHILNTRDGRDVEPPLHDTVFDYILFTHDGKRVAYAKAADKFRADYAPSTSYDYVHYLGTAQQTDNIVFGAGISPLVSVPANAFVFVDLTGDTQALAEVRDLAAVGSQFYVAPLATVGKPNTPWRPLGTAANGYTTYAVHGTTIDLATPEDAPNYAVVRGSLVGDFAPQVILPASDTIVVSGTLDFLPKAGINALNATSDSDYVQLLDRGRARMVRIPFAPNAKPIPVGLPVDGSILEVAANQHERSALVHLTSWTNPGEVAVLDATRPLAATTIITPAADSARVADELEATARDGTAIPISVIHRPGIALDGSHPLILQVAGAYGFSLTPDFRSVPEAWLARGGIFAVAHVRGGGELGEDWHRAGMGARKQITWTDLIAGAQRLIDAGYTSPRLLNLYGTTQSYLGGIASSIAIGRAIEERPQLFAAAVVDCPVFDLIRSERTKLGRQSVSEFGTATTEPGFRALVAMSPYEHVRAGTVYPPILIRSLSHRGLGDDWQAAKLVARLQAAAGRSSVAYLDVVGESADDKRGFSALRADALAFFLYEDGIR